MLVARHRGLSPSREQLPNGVVMLAKRSLATPAVTVHASFAAGSIYDPPDRSGAAYFVSKMIDRGTAGRSGDEIADQLEHRGMALNVVVNRHALQLVLTCLVHDLPVALDLLADMVMQPAFPEADIQTRRAEVITTIRQDEDNPAVVGAEAMMAALYGDTHPYGWRSRGSVEHAEQITRETLRAFHAARIAPDTLTLALVGDIDTDEATATAGRAFGHWNARSSGDVALPDPRPPLARSIRVIPMMNKSQTDVSYGFITVRRADPRFYACWLMNNILGQYSLGGRLGDSIRERHGMAYYVFSAMDANVIRGPLTIRAGVSGENVERTIASIDAELTALRDDGPTDKELTESKQYLVGSMPRTLETNLGIANFLQMVEHFHLGLDYDVRLPALLAEVTREDVQRAAIDLLDPERAAVVVAGPYAGSLR